MSVCSLTASAMFELCVQLLRRKQYTTLSPAERYSWPAVARGCNTIIVSHNAEQPLSYLAPLLSHILLNSIFTSLTSSAGVSTSAPAALCRQSAVGLRWSGS